LWFNVNGSKQLNIMNIVEVLLKELKVKHSKTFIEENYLNVPDSDNMLGIQRLLTRYNIETVGMHFGDKEEAGVIFPCILHMGDSFVVGVDLNDDFISYYDGKDLKKEESSSFNEKWTGNALLITDKQNAKEPGLIGNRVVDLCNTIVRYFLIVVFFVLGVLIISRYGMSNSISVNVIFDLMGIIICFLLYHKQLFSQTNFVDKVCSVLQKGGCDSILNSEESKLLGLISWTEIGLAYFSSRILCLFLDAQSLPLLQMIGWVAMLYGIWSAWFQIFKAKHWCTLCVMVQIIVWATGIYNIIVCQGLYFSLTDTFTISACFSITIIVIHIIAEWYWVKENYKNVALDFLYFKLQDSILKAALHESKEIEVEECDSSVIYGSMSAKITLSVLTNPHCSPCAEMHKRLMRLITENSDIKIQYIYSSFSKELDSSSLFMISVYQQKPYTEAIKILEEWYDYGRFSPDTFIKKNDIDIYDSKVMEEYAKHIRWKEKTGIQATPTIICSNHELPSNYSIEDLYYLDI